MERLVEEGELVSKNWGKQPYGGIATDSVVVMLVKKGNPLGLKSFKDLETERRSRSGHPQPVQLWLGPLEHHGRLRQRARRRRLARQGPGSRQDGARKDRSAENRPLVEGINTTEGTAANGLYIDYGSFEEVFVGAAANSAEMPNPGVLTQFVSKSGGNRVSVNSYFDYENESIQSRNLDPEQVRPFTSIPEQTATR